LGSWKLAVLGRRPAYGEGEDEPMVDKTLPGEDVKVVQKVKKQP